MKKYGGWFGLMTGALFVAVIAGLFIAYMATQLDQETLTGESGDTFTIDSKWNNQIFLGTTAVVWLITVAGGFYWRDK